jgi:hypothetical protein
MPGANREDRYRVWIATYGGGQPVDRRDAPPDAVAVEPAEEGTFSAREAARYVEVFNRAAAARAAAGGPRVWAVALPVVIRYQGDLQPGRPVGVSRR